MACERSLFAVPLGNPCLWTEIQREESTWKEGDAQTHKTIQTGGNANTANRHDKNVFDHTVNERNANGNQNGYFIHPSN